MKTIFKITAEEIKSYLKISEVLKYYGGECTNQTSGSWWCIMHEIGGKANGHKTPSLIAKDNIGTAICMSQHCFESDDIFNIIAKMEKLNCKNDFPKIKKKACDIAGILYKEENPSQYDTSQHSTSQYAYNAHISDGIEKDEGNEGNYTNSNKNSSKSISTLNISNLKELQPKHLDYLESIGITPATAELFALKSRYDYILYPQTENEAIIGYKGISITKDKATNKSKMFFEGKKTSLWHQSKTQSTQQSAPHLIFVEGEKDCMRLTEEIRKQGKENSYLVITISTGARTIPTDIIDKTKRFNPQAISIIYDNDTAGNLGSMKLAQALVSKTQKVNIQKVNIYSFNKGNKVGYDISDFLNEGGKFNDLWKLEQKTIIQEIKTLATEYPRYFINKTSILDTLEPDKILYTGYEEIDEKCPIILGENTIIVGRTGKGKTLLGVNFVNGILRNNADSKIMVLSLELKKKAFLQRLLAAEYNIETWKVKKGFIADNNINYSSQKEEYIKNAEAYMQTYKNRLMIIDDIYSIEQIEEIINNLKKNFNYIPDYVLIDYANILSLKNLIEATKHIQISTWIKFLAKEQNIHIQAVCQANRATKDNDDGYARTENLADSDQYGRDAFIVYSIKTTKENDVYSINPTKNRNGRAEEEIKLQWNAKSGKILSKDSNNSGNEI